MNTTTLTDRAQRLLAYLQQEGASTATNAVLAEALDASPRTVNLALVELHRAGLITVSRCSPHPVDSPSGRRVEAAPVTA